MILGLAIEACEGSGCGNRLLETLLTDSRCLIRKDNASWWTRPSKTELHAK